MGADEEYLLDVGLCPGEGIDVSFELKRRPRPLGSFQLVVSILADEGIGDLGVCRLCLGLSRTGAEGWDEFDAVLVESQRMAEMDNGIIRAREWQVFRN